jgi:hypothetical protein
VRMLGKLLDACMWLDDDLITIHFLKTCWARAVDHFLPGRLKKSWYMKM